MWIQKRISDRTAMAKAQSFIIMNELSEQGSQCGWSRKTKTGQIVENFAEVSEWDGKLLQGCELEMI